MDHPLGHPGSSRGDRVRIGSNQTCPETRGGDPQPGGHSPGIRWVERLSSSSLHGESLGSPSERWRSAWGSHRGPYRSGSPGRVPRNRSVGGPWWSSWPRSSGERSEILERAGRAAARGMPWREVGRMILPASVREVARRAWSEALLAVSSARVERPRQPIRYPSSTWTGQARLGGARAWPRSRGLIQLTRLRFWRSECSHSC